MNDVISRKTEGGRRRAELTTRVVNYTGYDTGDLARLLRKASRATGVYPKEVVFMASPIRSRGCSEIPERTVDKIHCRLPFNHDRQYRTPAQLVFSVAPPSRFSLRRLARLIEHEYRHSDGCEHEDMSYDDLYSLGPVPAWARGTVLRHRGRAPSQIP